jgi:hypothetical protein
MHHLLFNKNNENLKNPRKITVRRNHPNLRNNYYYASINLGKIQVLVYNIFQIAS